LDKELRAGVARGDSDPMILAAIRGPVSVNPIGAYDGLLTFSFFPAGSVETEWNSFNVGEFLFPQSRASLLPLLLVTGGLGAVLIFVAVRRDRRGEEVLSA
jgi:hypothetical protein